MRRLKKKGEKTPSRFTGKRRLLSSTLVEENDEQSREAQYPTVHDTHLGPLSQTISSSSSSSA
jgi:hypothetical protein